MLSEIDQPRRSRPAVAEPNPGGPWSARAAERQQQPRMGGKITSASRQILPQILPQSGTSSIAISPVFNRRAMNYEEQPRDFVGNAQPMSLEPSADGIFAQSPIDDLGDSLLEPHDLKHAAMLDPVSPEPSGLGSHSRNEQPGDDRLFTDGSGRHTGMRAHESASEYDDEVSIQSYNSFRKPVSSRGPAPLVNPGYSSPQFASAGRLEPHILQANGAGQRDVRLRPPPGGVDADPFAVQDSRARAQDSPAGYQPLAALAADRMHTLGSPKVEALSVHTDTAPPQRPSTSNSRIQAPDAREGDDPMLRFAECLEGWTNVLKQSILTDFRTSREALVRQHSQQAETLRTQSSYLIDDLTAQLRNSENVAASYLTMLENKSKLVERMLLYIVYKREKALSVRFFASWKVAYAHRQQVNYGQQLARQQHIRHQQRKALRGWQRVAGIHWKRSVEKKARREAESSMEKLATEYEKRIAELNARIETLTLRLQESDSNRAKQQEDVKKAFMRGLCALNMEAMSVLKTTDDGSSLIAGLMGGAKGDSAEADMSSNLGLSRVSEFAADRSDIRRTQPGPTRSAESAEQDGYAVGSYGFGSKGSRMTSASFRSTGTGTAALAEPDGYRPGNYQPKHTKFADVDQGIYVTRHVPGNTPGTPKLG